MWQKKQRLLSTGAVSGVLSVVGVDREVIGSAMIEAELPASRVLRCEEDGSGVAVARVRSVRGKRVDKRIVFFFLFADD